MLWSTIKNPLMAVVIAAALIIFVIFWDSPPEVFLSKKKTALATLPKANSYMVNSETHKFNKQGVEVFVLNTERGQFFQTQNEFIMDKPRIQANSETLGEPPWRLTANSGTVSDSGEQIVLRGDVRAWQDATSGETQFDTSQLTFYPNRNFAETDQKVTLLSPGSNVSGKGMKADFDQKTFQLLSSVKSKHHAVN